MRLVVELPDQLAKKCVITFPNGDTLIRLERLPKWYDITVVEVVEDKPKKKPGRPKKEVNDAANGESSN